MNLFTIFFIFILSLSNYIFAIDQDRLVNFFNDYSSNAQSMERLSFAVENGYDDVAEFLLLNGEPIKYYYIVLDSVKIDHNNFNNTFSKHPLITAIKNGYVSLSINMIKLIGNTDSIKEHKMLYIYTQSNRWSKYNIDTLYALQAAIESPIGYPIIEELIANGVNLNTSYSVLNSSLKHTGSTPLILSISNKKLDVARLLLEHGADANHGPPLYFAVNENYKEAIELLLSYGADPLKKTSANDLSPIELAIKKELWDIVDLFFSTMNH